MIQRAKKLHTLTKMVLSSASGPLAGSHTADQSQWEGEIKEQFSTAWGCGDADNRLRILDGLLPFEGQGIPVCIEDIQEAITRVKRKSKLDHYGISIGAISMLCAARPRAVASFFETLLASTSFMSNVIIRGRVHGKFLLCRPRRS